jgi:hypothetical protein
MKTSRGWRAATGLIDDPAGDPGNRVLRVADVELATLGWVHWHNMSRLHSYLNDTPPAELEVGSSCSEIG